MRINRYIYTVYCVRTFIRRIHRGAPIQPGWLRGWSATYAPSIASDRSAFQISLECRRFACHRPRHRPEHDRTTTRMRLFVRRKVRDYIRVVSDEGPSPLSLSPPQSFTGASSGLLQHGPHCVVVVPPFPLLGLRYTHSSLEDANTIECVVIDTPDHIRASPILAPDCFHASMTQCLSPSESQDEISLSLAAYLDSDVQWQLEPSLGADWLTCSSHVSRLKFDI